MPPKGPNSIGERFGKWTVIDQYLRTENEKTHFRKMFCLCICDCQEGKDDPEYHEIRQNSLLTGNSKSCGCVISEVVSKLKSKDFTNQRFGKLITLMRVSKRVNGYTDTRYWCKCDCGKYRLVASGHLKQGITKSCGCLQREATSKGGVTALNISLYDTYAHRLVPIEEVRRSPTNPDYLECQCAYCKEWFRPTITQVEHRISRIEGRAGGESRLYCGTECKNLCPIYGQNLYPKGYKNHINYRDPVVQSDLRERIIDRDGAVCIRCGSTEDLICHHIEGIHYNPIESADDDLCVIFCYSCHREIHLEDGCKRSEMRCQSNNYYFQAQQLIKDN